jgi:hypothetical protein
MWNYLLIGMGAGILFLFIWLLGTAVLALFASPIFWGALVIFLFYKILKD